MKTEHIKTVVIIKIHSHLTSLFKTDCFYIKIQKVHKFRLKVKGNPQNQNKKWNRGEPGSVKPC